MAEAMRPAKRPHVKGCIDLMGYADVFHNLETRTNRNHIFDPLQRISQRFDIAMKFDQNSIVVAYLFVLNNVRAVFLER